MKNEAGRKKNSAAQNVALHLPSESVNNIFLQVPLSNKQALSLETSTSVLLVSQGPDVKWKTK